MLDNRSLGFKDYLLNYKDNSQCVLGKNPHARYLLREECLVGRQYVSLQ